MSRKAMRIGLLGYGHMGKAMYAAMKSMWGEESIFVCDRHVSEDKGIPEAQKFVSVASFCEAAPFDILFLAVKPQTFLSAGTEFQDAFKSATIVSIMAGIPLHVLERETGSSSIIRAMPNLAASLGVGCTAYSASKGADEETKKQIHSFFAKSGEVFVCEKEDALNEFGAITASGPAYFFYLTELLEKQAAAFGFSKEESARMAGQTFLGAASLLEHSKKSATEWRKAVSSKEGMTEAAINEMAENKLEEAFMRGVAKAAERSRELGKSYE